MADVAAGLQDPHGLAVPLRVGMACGPVVAGVVGSRRFFYDVWGDAVNVASRMEATDSVGRIQVPDDMYEHLKDEFVLQERGRIEVKGKGIMRTWYLVGPQGGRGLQRPDRRRIPHGPRLSRSRVCQTAPTQTTPGSPGVQTCCRICGNRRCVGVLSLPGVVVLAWPGYPSWLPPSRSASTW